MAFKKYTVKVYKDLYLCICGTKKMQRFLCLRKVTLQNSRSKSIIHETTPKNGMQIVALNHIKRIIFVPPHHMMVEYIGNDKPIKSSIISQEVYKTRCNRDHI